MLGINIVQQARSAEDNFIVVGKSLRLDLGIMQNVAEKAQFLQRISNGMDKFVLG